MSAKATIQLSLSSDHALFIRSGDPGGFHKGQERVSMRQWLSNILKHTLNKKSFHLGLWGSGGCYLASILSFLLLVLEPPKFEWAPSCSAGRLHFPSVSPSKWVWPGGYLPAYRMWEEVCAPQVGPLEKESTCLLLPLHPLLWAVRLAAGGGQARPGWWGSHPGEVEHPGKDLGV